MLANTGATDGNNVKDRQLEDLVREAIERYATLRIWDHMLQIQADDGLVTLTGHVRTAPSKETAERIVRQVPGVRAIDNRLLIDTDLEIAVGRALAENAVTASSFPGILIGSAFGEIHLKGHVASPEIRQAAEQIAGQVPGVRAVKNELFAPEPPAGT